MPCAGDRYALVSLKNGATVSAGIEHDAYGYTVEMPANVRDSLAKDLD